MSKDLRLNKRSFVSKKYEDLKTLQDFHGEALEKWNGEGVISLCNYPLSVGYSTVGQDNETNYQSTEFWCAMEVLDDLKVPRIEESSGKTFSIVGRIQWLNNKN